MESKVGFCCHTFTKCRFVSFLVFFCFFFYNWFSPTKVTEAEKRPERRRRLKKDRLYTKSVCLCVRECVCECDMLARHGKITVGGLLTTGMLSELFELHIFFLLYCLLLQTSSSSSGCLLTFTFKADRKGRRGRKKRKNKRETLMKGTSK